MGTRASAGFTIIETMLFLAISGVLVISLLVGVGASLNVQRYHDATETFKNTIQQQYAALSNVQNGRGNDWSCDSNAQANEGGSEIRGQSECVILGKYLRIENGSMQVYTVLARQISNSDQSNDIDLLRNNYALNASSSQVEERSMEWGTKIGWPVSGAGASPLSTVGILFVRSPDTGLIYTFASRDIPPAGAISNATFSAMLVAGNSIPGQGSMLLCIKSDGLVLTGDTGLYIPAFASNSSAVELRTNNTTPVLAGNPKC